MERQWSRDWGNFDFNAVKEKMDYYDSIGGVERMDLGISREEFLEYLEWLSKNKTALLAKLQLYFLITGGKAE